jgi:hypothetical protein
MRANTLKEKLQKTKKTRVVKKMGKRRKRLEKKQFFSYIRVMLGQLGRKNISGHIPPPPHFFLFAFELAHLRTRHK